MTVTVSGRMPTVTTYDSGTAEIWQESITGLRVLGESNPALNPDFDLAVVAGYPKGIAAAPGLLASIEQRFLPKKLPPFSCGTPSNWNVDDKPYTPGTGPQRRNYVSVPLAMYLLTNDRKWFLAEVNWNLMQLQRPFCHVPWKISGDRYSRPWVNKGAPDAFQHNAKNVNGWTAFDYAHADSARVFGLAALGHPLGVINAALVGRWLIPSASPGVCTNWMTQDRSIGWLLNWGLLLALLDIGETEKTQPFRDAFLEGVSPKQAVKLWVEQLLGIHPDPSRTYAKNGRRAQGANGQGLPIIMGGADFLGTGKQIFCQQTFQVALMMWGIARVVVLNLVPQHTDALRSWASGYFQDTLDRAFDPQRGYSWAFGLTDFFARGDAQALLDAAEAEGVSNLEVHPIPNGAWIVRSIPRWGVEVANMVAPPAALLFGPDHPAVKTLLTSPDWGKAPQFDLATAGILGM